MVLKDLKHSLKLSCHRGHRVHRGKNQIAARTPSNSSETPETKVNATALFAGQQVELNFSHTSQTQGVNGATQGIFLIPKESAHFPLGLAVKLQVDLPSKSDTFAVPPTAVHKQIYVYILGMENELIRQSIQLQGETFQNQQRLLLIQFLDDTQMQKMKQSEHVRIVTTQMAEDVNGMKVTVSDQE